MEKRKIWSVWDGCHDTTDQQKRIASATTASCTPVFITPEESSGNFQSSRGNYETTLEHCNCGDFIRRHQPCKHMYRLAMEFGLLDLQYRSYSHGGYTWKQAIELLEELPEDVQKEFVNHFSSSTSASPYRRMKNPQMETLISAGYLIEYPENETAKYKTVHLIEDFMVDKQKLKWYFSRKFNPPTFFNGVEMEREELPEDEVTAFLRERGFVE